MDSLGSLLQASLLATFSEVMALITWTLASASEFFCTPYLELPSLKIHSLSLTQELRTPASLQSRSM